MTGLCLVGILVVNGLTFKHHIETFCSKKLRKIELLSDYRKTSEKNCIIDKKNRQK